MATSDIFVAKQSFVTNLDGREIVVHQGTTRVRAGHALLKNNADFFEPLTVQYDVESATAGPGEKRDAPKPAPASPPAPATEAAKVAKTAASSDADEK